MSFPWHDYSVIVITLTTIGMKVLQACVFLVVRVVVCGPGCGGEVVGLGGHWENFIVALLRGLRRDCCVAQM